MDSYYIVPMAIATGYQHLFKLSKWVECPSTDGLVFLGCDWGNDDSQSYFEGLPGVTPLPSRFDPSPVGPAIAADLTYWGILSSQTAKQVLATVRL